ncbi:MAG TPA: hypothetical protein VK468_07525, partial [Pyrinomonadaceae bacterium]|nr:hypothetical protein [Pyrinomonadaceae bacterium]
MSEQNISDHTISDYLLEYLPPGQAEQIDELTVTDEAFAERVRAFENDLVDSYILGDRGPEELSRFKSHYLNSPRRRERVEFARAFQTFVEREVAEFDHGYVSDLDRPPSLWTRLLAWRGLGLRLGFA